MAGTITAFHKDASEFLVAIPSRLHALVTLTTLPPGVVHRKDSSASYLCSKDPALLPIALQALEQKALQRELGRTGGVYIASRASLPERPAQWRHLRDVEGWHIISSWIDEAGAGETQDFGELWVRIENEIKSAERLIIFVEPDDFPLKGALVEAGIALAAGIKVFVVAPGVEIEPRTMRPLGSWLAHPNVTRVGTLAEALAGAQRK